MTVMVVLIRGINVGGRGALAMADLRRIAEACGYEDVKTYIQSGNLVLRTGRSAAAVGKELAAAIAAEGKVSPAVMVRTGAELAKVVAANPWADAGEDVGHLHVAFTDGKASLDGLDVAAYAPEEAVAIGREVHLLLPNGMGRSKLAVDFAKRKVPASTVRNWRTVTTLLEMAQATGAS